MHLEKLKTFKVVDFYNSRFLHISHMVTYKTVTGEDSKQRPEWHDAKVEVCNIISIVLYTQILKQSVLKPASPRIPLRGPSYFYFKKCNLQVF